MGAILQGEQEPVKAIIGEPASGAQEMPSAMMSPEPALGMTGAWPAASTPPG